MGASKGDWFGASGAEGEISPAQKASPAMPSIIEGGPLQPGALPSPEISPAEDMQYESQTPLELSSASLPPSTEPRGEGEEVSVERVRAATPAGTESTAREVVSVNHSVPGRKRVR